MDRGGSLPEDTKQEKTYQFPDEKVVSWKKGNTLVFDDSFVHAVRLRRGNDEDVVVAEPKEDAASLGSLMGKARVIVLMRGWHPELGPEERAAVRDFVRKGGEEEPDGYDMLPISPGIFRQ